MIRNALRFLPLVVVPLVFGACDERSPSAPASTEAQNKEKDSNAGAAATVDTLMEKSDEAEDATPTPSAPEEWGYGEGEKKRTATGGQAGDKTLPGEAGGRGPRLRDGNDGQKGVLEDGDIPSNMMFEHYGVNPTIDTDEEPRSTFAADVDTASYTMTRSFIERGTMPAEAAVRVEEVVNAFDYGYQAPTDGRAFNVMAEAAPSPNRQGYHVLHVGIKGKEIAKSERKDTNLVFVVDVSGSMDQENRLGLVKKSLQLLVNQLGEQDKIGIVAFGSTAREVLVPTSVHNKQKILAAVNGLSIEGATNAEAGLRMGYKMASDHFRADAVNRVILCSDGVANVGITGPQGILEVVQKEKKRGITISTIGVGMGTYNDVLMEQLADKGDGNYYYVDQLSEAKRVFENQVTGTLEVIAKDVKIQVEFNPKVVARYRLIGYENRALDAEEFENDEVDAGELGSGHSVTALYEIKLVSGATGSLGQVRVRYKPPTGSESKLVEQAIVRKVVRSSVDELSSPTQLSLAAAQFGEKLRGSYWARNLSYEDILGRFNNISSTLRGRADVTELQKLVKRAQELDKRGDKFETDHGPIARMDFDRVPVLR